MSKNKKKEQWNGNAEVMYQEGSQIPFIEVPVGETIPNKLFVWEFKQTGEYEPGPSGEDIPICDTDIHIYFNYKVAKEVLGPELLDKVRVAFGLEPLEKATEKGKAITERVVENAERKPEDVN